MPFRIPHRRPLLLAVALTAAVGAVPTAAPALESAAPAVTWKQPFPGATVAGTLIGDACEATATDADGIRYVDFYIDGIRRSRDYTRPYRCSASSSTAFDLTRLSAGAHTFKATAVDSTGRFASRSTVVNVQNSGQTTGRFSLLSLGALVSGQSVTAAAVVKASTETSASAYGVCVRDASGLNVDFPQTYNARITTSGTVVTVSKTFPAGSYTYFACVQADGRWYNVGTRKTFTVAAPAPAPAPEAPPEAPAPAPEVPTEPPAPEIPAPVPPTSPAPAPEAPAPAPTPAPTVPPTGTPVPNGPSGAWNLRFSDEFDGAGVDWTKWADWSSAEADAGHGNKGNQQLEWNQGANCSVSGGLLTITAKPDDITSRAGIHYDWSSCLLSSSPSYAFRYGYIETRAKFPSVKGFWPAFWTWQAASNPVWTETDVYEYYSDNKNRLYLSQHSGLRGGCTLSSFGFDPTAGFHTYGADIQATGTDFYIDGQKVCSAPGTATGMTNIILDMFVYSQIPPDPGTVAYKQVDYVRAWQR